MDKECPPGALSYPAGIIPFGPDQPILCVNDQCGYYYERPEVLAELHQRRFDSLIELAKGGMERGLQVFNVQRLAMDFLTGIDPYAKGYLDYYRANRPDKVVGSYQGDGSRWDG